MKGGTGLGIWSRWLGRFQGGDGGAADRLAAMQPAESFVGAGEFSAGRWTYWHPSARFFAYKPGDSIVIGPFTSVSPDVRLLAGGNHNVRHLSQYAFTLMQPTATPPPEPQPIECIRIGADVWLGTGAIVVGGVTIGDGAVVGAGAVVTRDVQPYRIVAGVPAREIGSRLAPPDVERMVRLRWWEWRDEEIRAAEPILRSDDISALEEYARSAGLGTPEPD